MSRPIDFSRGSFVAGNTDPEVKLTISSPQSRGDSDSP
jgi:hypothetical protein